MSATESLLFKRTAPEERTLPRVEAGDTPLASSSDLPLGPATLSLAALMPMTEAGRNETRRELLRAGFHQPHATASFAAIRYLTTIVPMLVMGLLLVVAPPALEKPALGGLVLFTALGWALPRLVLKGRAKERVSRLERAMPDMLDMLNMCVSQGMTVIASLERVGQELRLPHPELHRELMIVAEQARIGSLRHALENFNRRIDVPDVHSFTSLLAQTERMGTSISRALADYSDNIREGLKQRAEEKGNKAAFKLLFPTVLCLMPAVYLILLGPAVIEFTTFVNRDRSTYERSTQILRDGNLGQQPREPQ
jgi:tight adherence protein C